MDDEGKLSNAFVSSELQVIKIFCNVKDNFTKTVDYKCIQDNEKYSYNLNSKINSCIIILLINSDKNLKME